MTALANVYSEASQLRRVHEEEELLRKDATRKRCRSCHARVGPPFLEDRIAEEEKKRRARMLT